MDGEPRNGMVHVTGDGGWSGRVPEETLVPVEPKTPETDDKSWPPKALETK